jgi:hypothetical protein
MARIREVEDRDLEGVGRLLEAQGWAAPTACDWRWMWEENPAASRRRLPRGWVLVDQEAVVGFLGNMAQEYQFGDRQLVAAVAAGLVVAPAARGSSLQLMASHARQPNVDLLLNTTAAPHVSKISQFLKFRCAPQPTFDRSAYWVLRAGPFARAALQKKGVPLAAARSVAPLLALLLRSEAVVRRRWPRNVRSGIELVVISASSIGVEFDELWQRRLAECSRLLAVRDAHTLRWHFASRGRPHSPFLVCAFSGSELLGYVAVVRQDAAHIELRRARVADIFVEHDDPEIIRQLLIRSAAHARTAGADMLEVIGLPRSVRRVVDGLRPLEILDGSSPFVYKAVDPALDEKLLDEEVWYAGLFDGDGSI